MKRQYNFFALMVMVFIIGAFSGASGQGRGHHRGHEKGYDKHKHDNRDHDRDHRDRDWDSRGHGNNHRGYERRNVQHVYHYHVHDRSCNHAPVVVHHHVRPRYVYYRDYDVYYDVRRNVYITYSGRGWTISAGIPVVMRHVNIRAARCYEVDYWEDDFPYYLERRRPSYGRAYYGG